MKNSLPKDTKKKSIQSTSNLKTSEFTHEQLRDALMHVQEVMDRALVPFFVLGETSRHLHKGDEDLTGDTEVRVGVKKAELRREAKLAIISIIPDAVFSEYQISYEYQGVPVIIDIIHTDYKVFENPDTKFFWIENFKIPNPWTLYWQQREFIK